MKKSFLFQAQLFALFSLFVAQAIAQVPDRFNYQAVAKNAANAPIVGNVPVRFTILDGSVGGPEVYKETHIATADPGGVFALQVGGGTVQGGTQWSNVSWGSGTKFLKVEIDAGSGFVTMGTPQQLVSVPYAQYAKNSSAWSKSGSNVFNTTDNIGIGTATPGRKLEVKNNAPQIRLSDPNGSVELYGGLNFQVLNTSDILATFWSGNQGTTPRLEILGKNNWDLANTGGDFQISNGIERFKIGLALAGGSSGNANIHTSGNMLSLGQGANYNVLNIAGGKVGIGVLSPQRALHLFKDGEASLRLSDSGGDWDIWGGVDLSFIRDNNFLFSFTNTGRLGIGTTTPATPLHVKGGGYFEGGDLVVSKRIYAADAGDSDGTDIVFGSNNQGSGEWMGSKRTAGENQYGLDFYTSSQNRLSISNSGNIGIGKSLPTYTLHIKQKGFNNGLALESVDSEDAWGLATINNSNRDLNLFFNGQYRGYFFSGNGNYVPASDQRLKKGVRPISAALDDVMKLEPMTYRFIHQSDNSPRSYGFLAQSVEKILPDLVHICDAEGEYKGIYSLDYTGLGVVAIRAIQEQQAEIESLRTKITTLQSANDSLEKRLQALESKVSLLFEESKAVAKNR